ncbi:hypothetical protein CXG81DRAFT_14327 [Caulochytrium protostelioides]|uniref:DNA-directed RNA polymerase III subunit RPC6 n=1 Tax=Caulochytrium protostelioides TaxID=1555241 RepID=A0A4P9X3G5_9FUNG|nr:hypothetical protein CXG81DRAFT_14327 [Caulochytrium protostelioides]|eukprot:RKO99569.1 hypothetical protein CXG81DRAFT_14327 [Caulochytrium protostelioides]
MKDDELLAHLSGWTKETLVARINVLQSRQYIELQKVGRDLVFRARTEEEIRKTASLSPTERIVYERIKEAGNRGIWLKDIRTRSNLHQQSVMKCIKALENARIIKSVKSVKQPTKKTYMLAELEPSVELTGGAWYTDQAMDMEFIEALTIQIYRFILHRSYPDAKRQDVFSADHTDYPTVREVHAHVMGSGISSIQLAVSDVQVLLDRLLYDGKLSRSIRPDDTTDMEADLWMYRAVAPQTDLRHPLTEVPCSRCPRFETCQDGFAVSPETCWYFESWFDF